MDPDFMNNLANMLKNGNIPEDMKSKMNQFLNQNGQIRRICTLLLHFSLLLLTFKFGFIAPINPNFTKERM